MSTIASGSLVQPCLAWQDTAIGAAKLPWKLIATAFIVGLVFFVTGHDFLVSRAEAYTQTAEEMQTAALGGNVVRRTAFFALAGWGLVLFAAGTQPIKINWYLASSVGVLLALAAASVLWSQEPAMCMRRLLALFCCVVGAAGAARAFSLREIAWLVIIVVGSLAMVGVLTEIMLGTFRPWTGGYRFSGTVHPNTQGPALAALCVAAFALVTDSGRNRLLVWFIFAAGALLVLMTKSRTAAAALLAALAAIQIVKLPPRISAIGGMAAGWVMAAGLCIVWTCGFDPVNDFRDLVLLGRSDESESLSGRTLIWPEVIRHAEERFWLGYGYEAFWTPARIEDISDELGWGLREAHNGYLEMWLWLGAVGVAVCLIMAIAALAAAVRGFWTTNDAAYFLPLGLLVFGLFDSGLESGAVVISLVPFVLGCCVMRLTLFREAANPPTTKGE
jgi:O-antigen ligase